MPSPMTCRATPAQRTAVVPSTRMLPKTADQWVRKPNVAKTFGGRSALDRMMSGNVADLYVVRQYVDAQRG